MKKLIVSIKGMLGGMWMLASVVPAHATHLMGSDLTWQCLGNNQYKVILSVYRDCTGIPMSNTPLWINYHCATNPSLSGGGSLVSTPVINGLDVTPVCDDTCTACDAPNCPLGYGMELYQYEFTVNVSALKNAGCCKVRFYWTSCCRNDEIDNLQNPLSQSFYTYGEVDICDSQCNNGPAFTNPPLAFFCAGQDVIYNMGLVDVDNDSIVVTLAEPYSGGPTNMNPTGNFVPIPYVSGYSKNKPLKFLGWPNPNLPLPYGFHLNPTTGDLQFRPTQVGSYVIVLEIKEYRNGQLVGKTRRDIQVWIVDCPDNHTPKLSGINGTNSFSTEVCEEEQVCFYVYSEDVDTADSLTLSWNAAIPGATFIVTQPSQSQRLIVQGPTGQFCWTPPLGSASPIPYQFTASIQDDACPIRAMAIRSYSIKVKPKPQATYSADTVGCGKADFSATLTRGKYPTWAWNMVSLQPPVQVFQKDFTFQFDRTGRWHYYTLTVTADGCVTDYFDSIFIDTAVAVRLLPADTFVCAGGGMQFTADVQFAEPGHHIYWSTEDTDVTSVATVIDSPTLIKVTVTNPDGCVAMDSSFVDAKEVPVVDGVDSVRVCWEDSATLSMAYTLSDDSGRYVQWFFNGNFIDTGVSIGAFVQGQYIVRVTSVYGCWNEDTVRLYKNPPLNPNLSDTTLACPDDTFYLTSPFVGGGNEQYVWYDLSSTNPIGVGRILPVFITSPRTFVLHTSETIDSVYCEHWDTVHIELHPRPSVDAGTLPGVCVNADPLSLSTYGNPLGGVWDGAGVGNNTFYPNVAGVGTHTLYYLYTDPVTGCKNVDSTTIEVFPLPSVAATTSTGDTAFCEGEPAVLAGVPAGGVWTGDFVSGNIFHTADAGGGVHTVYYSYSDSNGCSAQDSLLLYVQPRPDVTLFTSGGVFCIGQPFTLHARYANTWGIRWFTYGDGQFSSLYDTVTTYVPGPNEGQAGQFRVGVTTMPVNVCPSDSEAITVEIHPTPVIDFTGHPAAGCPPLVVDFENLTTIARGAVARYEWIFSDGQRASLKNVRRVFDSTGVYDVTLIGVSDQGCSDTLVREQYIEVYPVPAARFSVVPRVTTVVTPRVRFYNESQGTSSSSGRSLWYFDDPLAPNGGWDSGWDAEHVYRDTGHYGATLWVWNKEKCVDSLVRTVVIKPGIIVYAPNAFSPDDQGPEANNVFRVVASGFSSFHLEVYDRWGKLVYASDDYATHGWDGTLDGREMAREGVYMWVVKVTDDAGKEYKTSGMITLLR